MEDKPTVVNLGLEIGRGFLRGRLVTTLQYEE